MKRKEKMALIDNYIEIFKILYKCKINFMFAKSQEEILLLENFCNRLIYLKDEHEKYLKEIKMFDNSFILLKKQLEDSLNQTKTPPILPQSQSFLTNVNSTEKRLNELKLKIGKKKKIKV